MSSLLPLVLRLVVGPVAVGVLLAVGPVPLPFAGTTVPLPRWGQVHVVGAEFVASEALNLSAVFCRRANPPKDILPLGDCL